MKKFAVFNPTDGSYKKFDSIEDALAEASDVAFNIYMRHVHETPFSTIEVAEDGTEIWRAPNGDIHDSPELIKAKLEVKIRKMKAFADAGVIPVTTL
jgi:hypothetical protein